MLGYLKKRSISMHSLVHVSCSRYHFVREKLTEIGIAVLIAMGSLLHLVEKLTDDRHSGVNSFGQFAAPR